MLVMDSGLGGLSVVRELRAARPNFPLIYLADTAGFPYGNKPPETISARAQHLIKTLQKTRELSTIVLACNTLSTLCLESLRGALAYNFVGTVPAIKTAAEQSRSKRFTLLATPNTSHSAYSDDLIARFANGCVVDRAPAPNLARYAEALLLGEPVENARIAQEIAPAFAEDARGRTDSIVLGCTHYPLIVEALRAVAPWEVNWIDSGAAIARRAFALAPKASRGPSVAYVTAEADIARYADVFRREGFDELRALEA